MNDPEDREPLDIVLPIAPNRKVADEWVLVLTSQGLTSRVERTPSGFILVVHPDDTVRAAEILATWWEENRTLHDSDEAETPAGAEPRDFVAAKR